MCFGGSQDCPFCLGDTLATSLDLLQVPCGKSYIWIHNYLVSTPKHSRTFPPVQTDLTTHRLFACDDTQIQPSLSSRYQCSGAIPQLPLKAQRRARRRQQWATASHQGLEAHRRHTPTTTPTHTATRAPASRRGSRSPRRHSTIRLGSRSPSKPDCLESCQPVEATPLIMVARLELVTWEPLPLAVVDVEVSLRFCCEGRGTDIYP
jgi:hypothetical protein